MDGVDLIRVLLELISALRLRRPVLVGSQSCLKYIAPSLYKTAITVAHTLISTVTTYLLSTSEETPIFNDWINGLQTLYRPRDCVCPMVFTRGRTKTDMKSEIFIDEIVSHRYTGISETVFTGSLQNFKTGDGVVRLMEGNT
ncbi:hypothetical protein F2Q68_00031307 [Brassica cretica]|uniref:Uncharacterized protein n=1 Tax=Brassica cretica TaxID=69181 RepID=A0A8S9G701_BRACR|nr:hypothetical protein F2Q68_00031307 [Brassica cretica]